MSSRFIEIMIAFKKIFTYILLASIYLGAISCKESPEQLLTAHTWEATHVWQQVANSQLFFERGNPASTLKLDFENIRFNKDGTGVYLDNHGVTSPLNWRFTDSSKTKISFTVQFLPPATSQWDILTLTRNKLEYVQRCTQGTTLLLSYEQRIPKK